MTNEPTAILNPTEDPNLAMPDKRKPSHVFGFGQQTDETLEAIEILNENSEWTAESSSKSEN